MAERILVVGGTGLVGNALARAWERLGAQVAAATYHCHPSAGFARLDMQDEAAVRRLVSELKPALVAVPAANPHVDYCELHPAETRKVNVAGTLNVARACREAGARMIFFSSDYVFDGRKGLYAEEDPPNPINEYGRQKAEVEAAVLSLDARNLVIRTSGAYGWQWEPKNFVMQILSRLKAKQPMKIAADLRYNPTYVENLAEVTAELAASGRGGIYHVVGADRVGRLEFAREVARAFGLEEGLLLGVSSAEFSSPTPRPKETSLKTDKVRLAVKTPLWGVRRSLEHMVRFEAEWLRYSESLPKIDPARAGS